MVRNFRVWYGNCCSYVPKTNELYQRIKWNYKIASKYKVHIKYYIDFDELFLFGSYAKGNPREHSNIDIAVVVYTFSGEYMKVYYDKEVDTSIDIKCRRKDGFRVSGVGIGSQNSVV